MPARRRRGGSRTRRRLRAWRGLFVGAAWTAREVFAAGAFDFDWFVWARFSDLDIGFGFLVDNLTCVMLLAVSFVSLMVHIYTIGYMAAGRRLLPLFRLYLVFHFCDVGAGFGEQFYAVVFGMGG